jgi:predicted transcriptional regulator
MMWNGLPVIRKEIAESMINDYGLNQKETAEKLGITPAAVCQYIARKRGRFDIADKGLLKEIKVSAETIIHKGNGHVISETCRICKLIRASGVIDLFCPGCDE